MTQNKQITTLLRYAVLGLMLFISSMATAQQRTDSLIINVGKSKIVFLVRDKQDLETLKSYDLNEILIRLSLKLENDSTEQTLVKVENGKKTFLSDTTIVVEQPDEGVISGKASEEYEENEESSDDQQRRKHARGTRHFFNVDLGTNNYLQEDGFPDENDEPYTVRPFGSWYVALSSTNRTYVGGPLYLEWGPSVSWYNFKFQNDRMMVIDGPEGTTFEENLALPDANFKKSKLTIAYFNFSAVPMFSFGESMKRKGDFWDWRGRESRGQGFRIGVGAYGGYRIASYTKVVYENGDKEKDKNKDNFHLNNFRYGLRLQMGYRGTDLFFNYDMNELFAEGKGPKLNAFSFGITF